MIFSSSQILSGHFLIVYDEDKIRKAAYFLLTFFLIPTKIYPYVWQNTGIGE